MMSLSKRLAASAAYVVVAILAASAPAKATLTASIMQEGGPPATSIIDNVMNDSNPTTNNLGFTGDIGDFSDGFGNGVTFTAHSNSPGGTGPLGGFITDTTIAIRNSSGAAQTLDVTLTDNGFLLPNSNPVFVTSVLSASDLTGAGSSASLVSTVDGTSLSQVSITSVGTQTTSALVPLSGTPYTITQLGKITLGAGQTASITFTTRAIATPEPGTLVMAFTSLGLFGVGRWASRRNKKA